jgi:nucleoside phosphorylase
MTTRDDYTVAWLCALPKSELVAARAMLDQEQQPLQLPANDDNTYLFGSINGHYIVIACLPPGQPGTISAGKLVQPLKQSFPNIKIHLFVGIGGGVPRQPVPRDPIEDIHLGDVVVGWAEKTGAPGVVQWDFVRYYNENKVESLGSLDKPDRRLLNALGVLLGNHELKKTKFVEHLKRITNHNGFSHPGLSNNKLYKSTYVHEEDATSWACDRCDHNQLVDREARKDTSFVFHQGTIVSGDSVMRDAQQRDKISRRFHNALCFEMEAAGVMDDKRCLIVRGIADYADSHKSDMWQKYAAATAAAFAREFLYTIQPHECTS